MLMPLPLLMALSSPLKLDVHHYTWLKDVTLVDGVLTSFVIVAAPAVLVLPVLQIVLLAIYLVFS